jgi:hypothetical protein
MNAGGLGGYREADRIARGTAPAGNAAPGPVASRSAATILRAAFNGTGEFKAHLRARRASLL